MRSPHVPPLRGPPSRWQGRRPRFHPPPISSDPPFHHGARRVLLPALAPRAIAKLEPGTREVNGTSELLMRNQFRAWVRFMTLNLAS